MPILIIPVLSTLIIGLIMMYLGSPITALNTAMINALASLSSGSKVLLGLVIGLMMALDMGSPVNKAAYLFGTATEGASPIMAGSAVTGMLSMLFNCTLKVPHGGLFVLAIPGVVGNLGMYIVSIAAGTVVTALLLSVLKKNVEYVGSVKNKDDSNHAKATR